MEESLMLTGPLGDIEAVAVATDAESSWAVCCHPHPLYGGSMDDLVIATAVNALRSAGVNTLRFNFRGVGRTEGSHDRGIGETDDVLAIADWLTEARGAPAISLVGYSFGAHVAWMAHSRVPNVDRIVLVAPVVGGMDFSAAAVEGVTVDVVVGSEDQFVSVEDAEAWAAGRFDVHVVDGADHFFSGRWAELEATLRQLV